MAITVCGAPPGGLVRLSLFFHLMTIVPLSLLAALTALEWYDFLRLYISSFRFFEFPLEVPHGHLQCHDVRILDVEAVEVQIHLFR